MNDRFITEKLNSLKKSKFRSSFHLKIKDKQYVYEKGIDTIEKHAYDFIMKRLSLKVINNDGKQTPTRGHPVFIAQHATATCCRHCFEKWHKVSPNIQLSPEQQKYAVDLIMAWIEKQMRA